MFFWSKGHRSLILKLSNISLIIWAQSIFTIQDQNQHLGALLSNHITDMPNHQLSVHDMAMSCLLCYVYRLCLPLQTYLWTDKWVTVWKCFRTSLGTPLCILFHFLLTYWHFLMLLGRCTVHRTLLTEGSTSTSALDSCMVQETAMTDGSASEALQACVQYMEIPLVDWRHTIHSVLYMAMPHRSYLYIR